MKRILFCFSVSFSLNAIAQDAHFSQYMNAPLYLNPACAGSWGDSRITVGSRYQWPKLGGDYKTYNFSYDQYIHAIGGGLGINCQHDSIAHGTFITDRVDLMYSGYIPFRKDTTGKARFVIQPGFQFGWIKNSVNWDLLTFGDMIDPRRGYIYSSMEQHNIDSRSNFDLAGGLLVYSKRIMGGFAVHHFTEPDISFLSSGKLPRRYTLHGSYIIGNTGDTTKHFNFIPSFMYAQQQDFRNFVWGLTVKYDKYSLGLFRRNADAVIFQVAFARKWFKVAYSFDLTTSDLKGFTGGSHEAHLIFKFNDKKWAKKILTAQHFSF